MPQLGPGGRRPGREEHRVLKPADHEVVVGRHGFVVVGEDESEPRVGEPVVTHSSARSCGLDIRRRVTLDPVRLDHVRRHRELPEDPECEHDGV